MLPKLLLSHRSQAAPEVSKPTSFKNVWDHNNGLSKTLWAATFLSRSGPSSPKPSLAKAAPARHVASRGYCPTKALPFSPTCSLRSRARMRMWIGVLLTHK